MAALLETPLCYGSNVAFLRVIAVPTLHVVLQLLGSCYLFFLGLFAGTSWTSNAFEYPRALPFWVPAAVGLVSVVGLYVSQRAIWLVLNQIVAAAWILFGVFLLGSSNEKLHIPLAVASLGLVSEACVLKRWRGGLKSRR
jgi:hypothetical protein